MAVLGLYDGHNAGGAIISAEGVLLGAVEEERFSRVKNHDSRPGQQSGPIESIRYCLEQAGREPVTTIAIGLAHHQDLQRTAGDNFASRLRSEGLHLLGRSSELGITEEELFALPGSSQLIRITALLKVAERAGVPMGLPVVHIDHHRSHAAGAFFLAPTPEALVITLDGKGDDLSGTVSLGHRTTIERIASMPTEDSLGHLYSAFTVACGLRPQRDEGKLQAMAASGSVNPHLEAWLQECFSFDTDTGRISGKLNRGLMVGPYPDRLPELHNELVRSIISDVRREDAAATIQHFLEGIVAELVQWHLIRSGMRNLVVAGGVFANVSLNRALASIPQVEQLHVHPAMTDAGIALGAAAAHVAATGLRPRPLEHVFLGPAYEDHLASEAFFLAGYEITNPADDGFRAEEVLAAALAADTIVARFVGAAEYGPRALGHRSILAPADNAEIPDQLNERLQRSTVMPFAPILRAKDLQRLLTDYEPLLGPMRHMTSAVSVSSHFRSTYPGVVHRDGTVRPQVVDDGGLMILLNEYERLSGKCVLINTSFNLHDEPMVCRPSDAATSARAAGIPLVQVGTLLARLPDHAIPVRASD